MQIKLFTIPILGGEALNEDLNVFLRSKKILHIENHILKSEQGGFWCFCVKYIEDKTISDNVKAKTDYKEVLDTASFERFSKMRVIRKQISQKEDIPAYAIFTDEELAAMAKIEELDHFIKEKLAIKAYVRYMDDMILWHNDKKALKNALTEIEHFVETTLKCSLKPIQLNRTETGLPFLGYHIFPHYMHLLQKSKTRFIRKINKIDKAYHTHFWNETACQRKILPLLAFISHAECKIFKKNVILRLKGIAS